MLTGSHISLPLACIKGLHQLPRALNVCRAQLCNDKMFHACCSEPKGKAGAKQASSAQAAAAAAAAAGAGAPQLPAAEPLASSVQEAINQCKTAVQAAAQAYFAAKVRLK